ncbi:hypothetical protein BR93DRAFT_937628 [Coniochaeta sp. PMI_546]|nr:hypothetical protein BR93DRAFT_937628 [Coniochaeta sp. PMI_546]
MEQCTEGYERTKKGLGEESRLCANRHAERQSNSCDQSTKPCVPASFPVVAPRYWMCYELSGTDYCLQIGNSVANLSLVCEANTTTEYSFSCTLNDRLGKLSRPWINCADPEYLHCGPDEVALRQVLDEYSLSRPTSCPSGGHTLLMFACVNLVVGLLSLVIGYRPNVYMITLGCFGRYRVSNSWIAFGVLSVCLQLAANAIIGASIRLVPGYSHLNVWRIMLLLVARPRVSWAVLLSAHSDYEQSEYRGSASSAFMAEFVLFAIATYTMTAALFYTQNEVGGLTIHYDVNPKFAYIMSAGAFLFMFFVFPALIYGIYICVDMYLPNIQASWECETERLSVLTPFVFLGILPTLYLGSWLFWVGFVYISAEE